MTTTIRIIMGLAVAGCVTAASAQGVWRCGNTYVQQPCPEGRQVNVQDTRTAAERAANRESVQQDQHLADDLQRAREKAEAQPASAYIPPKAEPDPITAPEGKMFNARGPSKKAAKGKKKASAASDASAGTAAPGKIVAVKKRKKKAT